MSAGVSRPQAGRTSIRAQALRTLVRAIVADAADVPPARAAVAVRDRGGSLAVTASVPVVVGASVTDASTLVERAAEIRRRVVDDLGRLAGRATAQVDVRFAGTHRPQPRRVA